MIRDLSCPLELEVILFISLYIGCHVPCRQLSLIIWGNQILEKEAIRKKSKIRTYLAFSFMTQKVQFLRQSTFCRMC